MSKQNKVIAGRVERISFPDWNFFNLDSKIDTGAHTSSLHCHDIKLFVENEKKKVRFYLLDPKHPEYERIPHTADVLKIKSVKSSNGLSEERVIISANALFMSKKINMNISLTDRSFMKYPVLIGRRFLKNNHIIVDASKVYLLN